MKLSSLEKGLRTEWLDYMSEHVDREIPNYLGVIELAFKWKDVLVTICTDETNYSLVRFEINDIHVWNYLINERYAKFPKTVSFSDCIHEGFEKFEFETDFNKKFSELFSGYYKQLADECFAK